MYLAWHEPGGAAAVVPGGFHGLAQSNPDPAAELGRALWEEAPAGVAVAIYNGGDREQKARGIEWAERQGAIGPRRARLDVAEVEFGRAMADTGNLSRQVLALHTVLGAAVSAAPQPAGVTPKPGTGPGLIRTLALFTHGTTNWIGVGGGISASGVAAVVRRMAAALANDITIILYGCSSARGSTEPSNWVTTTTGPGGVGSLAAKFRDALLDAGKTEATVWGHTEVGHTTRNPSLRFFTGRGGKGSPGRSYLSDFVFGTVPDILAWQELAETVAALGFRLDDARQAAFRAAATRLLRRRRYSCWVGAVVKVRTVGGSQVRETNITYGGANLPEVAPLYPFDVAEIVRRRWTDVCWTDMARLEVARQIARALRLPAQPGP